MCLTTVAQHVLCARHCGFVKLMSCREMKQKSHVSLKDFRLNTVLTRPENRDEMTVRTDGNENDAVGAKIELICFETWLQTYSAYYVCVAIA